MVAQTGVREGFMYNYVLAENGTRQNEGEAHNNEILEQLEENLAEKGQVPVNE